MQWVERTNPVNYAKVRYQKQRLINFFIVYISNFGYKTKKNVSDGKYIGFVQKQLLKWCCNTNILDSINYGPVYGII